MNEERKNEQKSKADELIESLDKVLVEAGYGPTKVTEKICIKKMCGIIIPRDLIMFFGPVPRIKKKCFSDLSQKTRSKRGE